MRLLSLLLVSLLLTDVYLPSNVSVNEAIAANSKKKKKKKKRKKKKTKAKSKRKSKANSKSETLKTKSMVKEEPQRNPASVDPETGRKQSRLHTGETSRWSNRGAMNPIETEVPVQAPLPKRAQPIAEPVATPGQKFTGKEGQISARVSLSLYHLETQGQDVEFVYHPNNPKIVLLRNLNRDIDLYRFRTDFNYTRIAGTWFSTHLDAEYRGSQSISRPKDYRLNALYLSYGLSSTLQKNAPRFGFQLGRVVIPEAGGSQVDGLAGRYRLLKSLTLGGFGGVSGNPFRYNWQTQANEEFSTDWKKIGSFVTWRERNYYVDVAGVASFYSPENSALDRLFFYVNSGASLSASVDLFLSSWFDWLPDRQSIQNLQAVGTYRPTDSFYLRLALERFSTVRYRFSTPLSFQRDPDGSTIQTMSQSDMGQVATSSVVDQDGNPIVGFDSIYQVATYHAARVRAGYRWQKYWEPFVSLDTVIRIPDEALAEDFVEPLRLLPGAGLAYRNNKLFDFTVRALGIIDKRTSNQGLFRARVSRAWKGTNLTLDGQWFVGGTSAADGGVNIAYMFPRDWFPGRLQLRGAFRYYQEDVSLLQPISGSIEGSTLVTSEDQLRVIPVQESYLGYLGIDWKL